MSLLATYFVTIKEYLSEAKVIVSDRLGFSRDVALASSFSFVYRKADLKRLIRNFVHHGILLVTSYLFLFACSGAPADE